MDRKGHSPQYTISHCIISTETQLTLHVFNVEFLEIRADLFLAIPKTGMCLLTLSVFKRFTILVPS